MSSFQRTVRRAMERDTERSYKPSRKARVRYKTPVLAVPTIIEKGVQIGSHFNHKSREYPTYTFCGKITIGNKTGIMAVVVKKTTNNFYNVHRVFTIDGKTLGI